jgi:hydroxymethylglutaryl-CoA reductase (NADPH)
MLLAFYLATGQDAANIVEGSQGFTYAEDRDGDLYFSCSLPNLIVGTHGHGKDLPQVRANLDRLGCGEGHETGATSRRLAVVCAATVLCGELSLLAAQTNPGELMQSHLLLERSGAHV